ncbi:uncharacterized protein LOC129583698 [Paramacrobiotus metropolitanus]|uniref:uncharacterized protein LOC129583698 n=1 Tax=Paramacrobiotus metropolitanus TaxID=2943436 RepID=UPI0024460F11|nr:uncharacterized protein LOC129583698 [Paramacrobiotus metropolitanus]XP_055331600.1 uncharacterized protein LOC129583698 [Paramacrobiotus metropolitanus]
MDVSPTESAVEDRNASPSKHPALHDTIAAKLENHKLNGVESGTTDSEHENTKPASQSVVEEKKLPIQIVKPEPSLTMSTARTSDDSKMQNGTGSYGKSEQVPSKGKYVKRLENTKYIKETTVTEQYYDDGVLRFSHPPDIQRVETSPPNFFVNITECTDEAFRAGEMRAKKRSAGRSTATPSVDKEAEPEKFHDSDTNDGEIVKRKRPSRATTLLSEDEEDEKVEKLTEKRRKSSEPVEEKYTKGTYVLAKYNDNNYYPAQIIVKDAQPSRWRVKFTDSKEEDQIHETDLLKPGVWLTVNRAILIKAGNGLEGGEYQGATITQLIKEEGKAPRYIVKIQDSKETKTVNLAEVAIEADEVLREKFGNGTGTDKNAVSAAEFDEGTVVFGQWSDGCYYPGKITSFNSKNKQYDVEFLDNETATLSADQLVLAQDMVKADHSVQVKIKTAYEKGQIVSVTGTGDTTQAMVRFSATKQEDVHISELVFDKSEVKKVQKAKVSKKDTDTSSNDTSTPQRSRQSTRISSTTSPPKPKPEKLAASKPEKATATPKAKPEPKSASKAKPASAKKSKAVEEIKIEDDDEEDEDDQSRKSIESDKGQTYTVGKTTFKHKEQVFGKWEDGRWYAAWVTGVRQSKLEVSWCENQQRNHLVMEDIIRAADILEEGLRVNVIVEGKNYYDEVVFEKWVDDGPHLVKSKKKQVIEKKFEEMMIQNDEVGRWRKKRAQKTPTTSKEESSTEKTATPKSSSKATPSAKQTSPRVSQDKSTKKRARSTSSEDEIKSAKSSKKPAAKASSPLEESPPRDTQGPPLSQCSFIITSGGEKDPSFDRDYIVSKVTELGGNVLNAFDDLVNVAGKRYLISPSPCRTAKFLQCLAANFPCVSHKWILDIADKNKFVDCGKYRLKTGKSSTDQKLIDWTPRKTLLDNMRIALYGGVSFRSTWVPALKQAKATPTVLEDQDTDSNMKRFDVVIVEDRAPAELISGCKEDSVPVTTVEWLIQTLIHGKKMEFASWPYQEAAPDG